jgi:hypothetical protein
MRKIDIKNIHVLANIISKYQPKDLEQIVRDYTKKQHVGWDYNQEYRPGSDQYIRQEKKKAEILALPDYDIKYIDEIQITDGFSKIIELDLGVFKRTEIHRDDYYEEGYDEYEVEKEYYFLVINQYRANSIFTSFDELFTCPEIYKKMVSVGNDRMFIDLIKSYKEHCHKYFYLLKKEIKIALREGFGIDITSYTSPIHKSFLEIKGMKDSKKYYLNELDEILKVDYYWYENRKVRFGDNYRFDSVMEEYAYAKDNLVEEEQNS